MLNNKKQERENKVKQILHDAKIFVYGVSISTGLIIGFVLGVNMNK